MKHKDLLSEKDQERLYLVHHMHHYPDKKEVIHELHHCFLFSKKNMSGDKYSLNHFMYAKKLYHVLNKKSDTAVLYDHANREHMVGKLEVDDKTYYFIS